MNNFRGLLQDVRHEAGCVYPTDHLITVFRILRALNLRCMNSSTRALCRQEHSVEHYRALEE